MADSETKPVRADQVMPSPRGSLGLVHMSSADLGPPGILRFSAIGEYSRSFNFPSQSATNTRGAGNAAISFVPVEILELYLAFQMAGSNNSSSTLPHTQSLGDFSGGAKLARRFAPGLHAGIEARGVFSTRFGDDGVQQIYRYGVEPKLLMTYDFAESVGAPIRVHVNAGAAIDSGKDLARSSQYGPIDQYVLNLNQYNRLLAGGGLELRIPVIAPFGEYGLAYPIGVPGRTLTDLNGNSVSVGRALPQIATFGLRITPVQNLTFTAGVDLPINQTIVVGLSPTPRYNAYFGAAYAVDALHTERTRTVRVVERQTVIQEVELPSKTGQISGVVIDAATKKPLSAALITVDGVRLPPVASDPDGGRFLSYPLPAATATMRVTHEGYEIAAIPVAIREGRTSKLQIELVPLAKRTRFLVSVASGNSPVYASVRLRGPVEKEVSTIESGGAAVAEVVPGRYIVSVTAEGYLAQNREAEIAEGADQPLVFALRPEPKQHAVEVRGKKIELNQRIHFATGQAVILPDSFRILDEVVDAIIKKDIPKVRVEGHTDNRGGKNKNLQLSEQRARAVADYLVKSGIEASRLESRGLGDARPVVPNMTSRGRELNRRVELYIVDGTPEAATATPAEEARLRKGSRAPSR